MSRTRSTRRSGSRHKKGRHKTHRHLSPHERAKTVETQATAYAREIFNPEAAKGGSRWLTLFLITRVSASLTAIGLLFIDKFATHEVPLLITALGLGTASVVVGRLAPHLHQQPLAWLFDAGITLGLVAAVGDWRSPFYLMALTSLILPVTVLSLRQAVLYGTGFTVIYLLAATRLTLDLSSLEVTTSPETLSTYLIMPILISVALAYASEVLSRLDDERERSEQLAIEAERKRIAWELHDSAKQRVHAAHLVLSSIQGQVPENFRPAVDLAVEEMRFAVADMETSLNELRTPLLEGKLLSEALRERARELENAGKITFKVSGEARRLPPFIAAHVYRIASEAMTNALRHADATYVEVNVKVEGGVLKLTVIDNGRGMPGATRPGSHGIPSMINRAKTIGGTLTISAGKDEKGTTIKLHVPLTSSQGEQT